MIGFYDYTVIATYISLLSSIFGITQAIDGHFRMAIFCLAFSGFCDMFDGKIARTKKNRTDDEKLFGIQLDSLCDVICFGAFPAVLCYIFGVRGIAGGVAIGYYGICSVIRLAFFNVLETNRQRVEEGCNQSYRGLPITSISVILPLVFLCHFGMSEKCFIIILYFMLFIVGTLFILDFKVTKPDNKTLAMLVVIVGIAVIAILVFSRYRIVRDTSMEKPWIVLINRLLRKY